MMEKRIQIIFTAFIAAMFMMSSAQAQYEYIAHYQAYNEALAQGDMTTAIDQAENAWRAAERELGDHQTTAVLAYNFANLVYFIQPQMAVEPLTRILEISPDDSDTFGIEKPGLMLLLVNAFTDPDARDKERALHAALSELEDLNPPDNLLAARAWLHLAGRAIFRSRYERAEQYADFSIRHYTSFIAPGELEVANALILGRIARVAGRSRNTQDLRDAVALFDQAIEIIPPQTSIDTFDSQLAIALAWRATTVSAAYSDVESTSRTGSRLKTKVPELDINAIVKWDPVDPNREGCEINWADRTPPTYPKEAGRRGYFGAVVIGYNIVDGNVHGARILAEVPAASIFGETSLASMEQWQLVEELPAKCRSNRLIEFRFAFDN